MADVLLRAIDEDDLSAIRAAASTAGVSLQRYLRDALHAQADYLRRQAALARAEQRLQGQGAVPADERAAVLDAVDEAHAERSASLGDAPPA